MSKIWVAAVTSLALVGCTGTTLKFAEKDEDRAEARIQAIQNEVALSRLVGYVRYFHPSDQAAQVDWQQFLAYGFHALEGVPPGPTLANKLEELIRPIAPTVRVFSTGRAPALPTDLSPSPRPAGTKLVCWRRIGLGEGRMDGPFSGERLYFPLSGSRLPPEAPSPHAPYEASLGGGIACRVPQALYADSRGTLPHGALTAPWEAYRPSVEERRLAIVAATWNVPRHFYPNFDAAEADWLAELPKGLRSARVARDEHEFHRALRQMVARLEDGHGDFYWSGAIDGYAPPINLVWAEGKVVVGAIDPSLARRLRRGDVVIAVDGQPVLQRLADEESLVSGATPQWIRHRALSRLLCGRGGSALRLDVDGPEGHRTVHLSRMAGVYALESDPSRPSRITELAPGVFHLDAGSATDQDFRDMLPRLQAARGLIIDLRGGSYPDASRLDFWDTVMPHLIDRQVSSPRMFLPVYLYPDQAQAVLVPCDWTVAPRSPNIRAKLAFLSDGGSVSQMELWLEIARHYQLGALIGEPTAGTNGEIDHVSFGDFRLLWTGMKVLKHDGSRSHGVGIKPTVPVQRTLAGIRSGRDEILEAAVQFVSNQAAPAGGTVR